MQEGNAASREGWQRSLGDELFCPTKAAVVLCATSFFVYSLAPWAVNAGIYPEVAMYFGLVRELATAFAVVCFLSMALIAMWKPGWLDGRLLNIVAIFGMVSMLAVLCLSFDGSNGVGTFLGLAFRCVADVVVNLFLILALCSIGAKRAVYVVLAGSIANSLVTSVLPSLNGFQGAIVLFLIMVVSLVCGFIPARGLLRAISHAEVPAVVELTNPRALLPWKNGLFECMLIFGLVYGFSLSFRATSQGTSFSPLAAFVLVAYLMWIKCKKGNAKEDALFSIAALFVVIGLALIPVTMSSAVDMTSIVFSTGSVCVGVLVWLSIVSISERNMYAVLPSFFLVKTIQSLGVLIGAQMGHAANTVSQTSPNDVVAFAMAALVCFVALLWVRFKRFSFVDVTEALTRLSLGDAMASDKGGANGDSGVSIEEACEGLSSSGGLTNRESEILVLLARGRNGAYIQEHYVISRNTAKTHIRHIYEKLGVHSHQELIDLVERTMSAPDGV